MINCAVMYLDKAACECSGTRVDIAVGPDGVKLTCTGCGLMDTVSWDKLPIYTVVSPDMGKKLAELEAPALEAATAKEDDSRNPLLDALRNYTNR